MSSRTHRKSSASSQQVASRCVVVRSATTADALCLSALAIQVFLDTYARQGIRDAIAREVLSTYTERAFCEALGQASTALRVAESSGHLVGFAQVTLGATHALAPPGEQSELLRLYVQEPFTAQGVGTLLLADAERIAGEANTQVFWLTPWVHNSRALRFYQRRGYDDFGLTHFESQGESHENRVYAKQLARPPRAA